MQHSNGFLPNGLYWQSWQPDTQPRAIILIAHGLAEHGARYQHVAERLVASGYAVYVVDHVGHGESPGARAALNSFGDLLDGIDQLYALAVAAVPETPVFIIGHSMGGLIAAMSAIQNPDRYTGVALSGPAVIPPEPPPMIQLIVVRLLSRLAPKLGVVALDANAISRDPAEVQKYMDDPLVYNGKVTARMAAELFDTMDTLRSRAGEIHMPLLAMHGSDDTLTAPEGSRLLVEKAGSTDKTLREFPGLFHEIFNEPQRDEVLSVLVDWLEQRS